MDGRRGDSENFVFPLSPVMGKGARRADRGEKGAGGDVVSCALIHSTSLSPIAPSLRRHPSSVLKN